MRYVIRFKYSNSVVENISKTLWACGVLFLIVLGSAGSALSLLFPNAAVADEPGDTRAPQVTFTAPPVGATVNDTDVSFHIEDDTDIHHYEFTVTGPGQLAWSTRVWRPETRSVSVSDLNLCAADRRDDCDKSSLPSGTYKVRAAVYDGNGHRNITTTTTFILDNTTSGGNADPYVSVGGVGAKAQGADIAITNLDSNPRPDMILMAYDNPKGANEFRYRVGHNLDEQGRTNNWTHGYIRVEGVGWEAAGAGMAIAYLDNNPRPELILMAYDDPPKQNEFRYRVGYNLGADGRAQRWTKGHIDVEGVGWEGQGADVLVTNLDNNPRPDMILMAYDNPSKQNEFRYRVGFNLDAGGRAEHWLTGHIDAAGVGWEGQGAGAIIANYDGDRRPDLLLMAYDNPSGGNEFRYRVGFDLNQRGQAARWSHSHDVAGVGALGAGAGMALANLDTGRAARAELVVMAYDDPRGANEFRYRVVRNFAGAVTPRGGTEAHFTWRIAPRYGLGWIAYDSQQRQYRESYVDPDSWRVVFNACDSSGGDSAITAYRWHFEGLDVEGFGETVETTQCALGIPTSTLRGKIPYRCLRNADPMECIDIALDEISDTPTLPSFPEEGSYSVTLTVTTEDFQTAEVTKKVVVEDLLIVSIGDSNASGEGNPDEPVDWQIATCATSLFFMDCYKDGRWQDIKCHRSTTSGPSLAAAMIERKNPHTTVTFISVACTGAEIDVGLLEQYSKQPQPQLEWLRQILCKGYHHRTSSSAPCDKTDLRTIDALFISIGVNDVGFSGILGKCLWANCGIPEREGVYEKLRALAAQYDALSEAIARTFNVSEIYITEYPAQFIQGDSELLDGCGSFSALDIDEVKWLEKAGEALNQRIQEAARAHAWNYVGGIVRAFSGHGYCSTSPWYVDLSDSIFDQTDIKGTVHPNQKGHEATARQIVKAFTNKGLDWFDRSLDPSDIPDEIAR